VPFLAEWLIVDEDAKEIIEKIKNNQDIINDKKIAECIKSIESLSNTYKEIIKYVK